MRCVCNTSRLLVWAVVDMMFKVGGFPLTKSREWQRNECVCEDVSPPRLGYISNLCMYEGMIH